ncbi:MAG: SDR family oxidoreductase [Synergistaceae bacterium]|jgi:3-oxoacyl-[acyl-carrier protein] reductase|nr:SDR family oxidoreductase [Synergistaceae bacterium]
MENMLGTSEFRNKRVVITGAAGIFGIWIAEAFAAHGSRLCLTDIRDEKLTEVANRASFKDIDLLVCPADLTKPDSIAELCASIEKEYATPDILINNAGLYTRHKLLDMTLADWEKMMAVNLTSTFLLTQAGAKMMIHEHVEGSIINISSGAAVGVSVGGGAYSTSKAALAMLTRAWALELAPHGIRINSVAPGFAPGSEVSGLPEEHVKNMLNSIPLERTSGPNDASEAILFLCSSKASFITGTTLSVDGGRTAGTYKKAPKTSPLRGEAES